MRFVAINDYGNRFFMDNVKIDGQNILSINEIKSELNIAIYPNPTTGIFTIRTDLDNIEIEIYSTIGRLVLKKNLLGGLHTINISDQPKGIYFIKIQNGTKTEQRKLIIQ